jgi:hypothetical protein
MFIQDMVVLPFRYHNTTISSIYPLYILILKDGPLYRYFRIDPRMQSALT